MSMRLELVPLLTTDVDRSKVFYVDHVGFNLDHDVEPGNGMRVVQLTPPGSACSIVIGVGISDPTAAPVHGLHLVVDDLDAVRQTLRAKGVGVSDISDMGGGVRYAYFSDMGGGVRYAYFSDMGGGVRYAYFSDPDGNSWALQQISGSAHLPE